MPAITQEMYSKLNQVIEANKGKGGAVMITLQAAQDIFGYVPKDVQIIIADGLGVTLSEVYGVATFYSQFALEPRGEYVVGVCMGTACYVKGAGEILDKIKSELGLEVGVCSDDGRFYLEATRCIGACGLAPVITVNDDVYGKLVLEDVPGILAKYTQ